MHGPVRMSRMKLTRNRITWWLAALLLLATIALTYRLTRPPELVWWTSPPLMGTHRRVTSLSPSGWDLKSRTGVPFGMGKQMMTMYELVPVDRRSKLLQRLLPRNEDAASLVV